MMRRRVPLLSLTVGRCFTLPPTGDGAPSAEADGPKSVQVRSLLGFDQAWKVTGEDEGAILAEDATGDEAAFDPHEMVVEVPREGYERLVQRAAEELNEE